MDEQQEKRYVQPGNGETVSPGRLPVELIFWGSLLIILGYMIYGRLGGKMLVAPHAMLGRILVLLGAAILSERTSGTPVKRPATTMTAVVCLANLVWMVAWSISRLAYVADFGPDEKVIIRRCNGFINCADSAIFLAVYWFCRKTGVITPRRWRVGAVVIGVSGLYGFSANIWLPRTWGFISSNIRQTRWLYFFYTLVLFYWFIVLYFLSKIRILVRAKWLKVPAAKKSDS